jgi:hypothetical protein
MLDEAILEQRLAAIESAVADLQRRVSANGVPGDWLQKFTGCLG